MMNVNGVRVKIFDEKKCIYERETKSNENDLKTLLRDLRNVQSEVNDYLTTLIQQQDVSDSAQNITDQSISSDIEPDSCEEEESEKEEKKKEEEQQEVVQVNPKKCKLST